MDSKGNVSYKEVFKEYPDTYAVMVVTKRDTRGFAELFQLLMTSDDFTEAKESVDMLVNAGDEDPANIIIIPTKDAVSDKVVAFNEDENIKTALSPEDYSRFVRVYLGTGAY